MGFHHGFLCVGCCWALMALLFFAGVMNLVWVAGIGAFVLIEKLAPQGVNIGRLAGAVLVLWALYVFVRAGTISTSNFEVQTSKLNRELFLKFGV